MAISYKENQVNGKQRGPDGKLYVIPGGPLDPAAKNNKVEAPKYFEGATDAQKAAFDKGIEFVNVGGGVFQNRMGQYVDAGGRATTAPPPVAPKSMDDRASDLLSGQLQDQQKLADELGLDTQYPTTFEGIIQERADAQAREAAQARAELERQKELIIQQAGDVKKSAETQIAGVKSALAQDREGPFSVGNVATQERTTAALKEQIDRAIATQNAALQKVQNIEQAIKDAERQGNRDLVDLYQGQLEAAKFELTQADTALLDAQVSASEEARAVQEATRQNFETFTSFVNEGQTLTVQGIKNLAGQLNIDFESAFDYYQSVENIRVDKSLSQTEKEIALQDAALELDRKMTNRDLEEVRKVDYLTSMYQSGASQEEISAFKQLSGITDQDDPLYQAELKSAQAKAKIDEALANGEIVNPLDKQQYAINQLEIMELMGDMGAYQPTSSKYEVSVQQDGSIDIDVPVGVSIDDPSTGRDEGQCGAFVNDMLGIGVGDTLTSKTKFIDESIVVPEPGMAYVVSGGYDLGPGKGDSGHIGIVTRVTKDGFYSTDANLKNDRKVTKENFTAFSDSKLQGFIKPPNANYIPGSSNKVDPGKLTAGQIQMFRSWDGKKVPDAWAGSEESFMSAYNQFQDKVTDPNISLEDKMRFSVGGKELLSAQANKLDSFATVVTGLQNLESRLDSVSTDSLAPIIGIIQNNNPWDDKRKEIDAIITGLVPGLARGVYGEVGVLTDTDIERYQQLLPTLKDTQSQREALVNLLKESLATGIDNTIRTAASSGRDVSGFTDLVQYVNNRAGGEEFNAELLYRDLSQEVELGFDLETESEIDSIFN